ncbi:hypothetical protein BDFB_004079 [Asbolus verrucosus]|uniref:C2H2-type domain-containing protein n=1 Tax=Asbolus verrucosus TaxID=1661398 RepID=A0A482W6D7_ASBVE|nr:hypothetical protein BDFB_004079 [Asbolus verrucosus]
MEPIDDSRNFHKCKVCPYRTHSIQKILSHIWLHRTRNKEDLFVCNLNAPQTHRCDSCDVTTHFKVLLDNHTDVVHNDLDVNCDLRHVLQSYECGKCDFRTCSIIVLLRHFQNTAHESLNKDLWAKSSERWFECMSR